MKLRSLFLFACLLGLFNVADAVAASSAATTRHPNRKILPGNHRPNYRLYGHHGLFSKGLFSGFRSHGSARPSGTRVAKKRRGTL